MTPAVPPRGAAPSTLGSSSPASELSTGLRISSWSADGIDPEPKSLTVAPSSMPSIAALQRSPDDGASRAGTILLSRPLQRADEAAAPTEAAAAQAAAGGGSAAGASAGTGPSARELDELAKKLYEPLRRRLHRELLVDRERDGSLLSLGR